MESSDNAATSSETDANANVAIKNVANIDCMFYCCNLEFIELSLFNFNNDIKIHGIFDFGPKLKQIKTNKITCDKILEVYPEYKNIIIINN